MWVPKQVVEWFQISKDSVDSLRTELASVRSEKDSIKAELARLQITFDWMRINFNTLQIERAALMEKAYGIKVAAPELVRTPVIGQDTKSDDFSFNDIGDDLARQIGLPVYGTPTSASL